MSAIGPRWRPYDFWQVFFVLTEKFGTLRLHDLFLQVFQVRILVMQDPCKDRTIIRRVKEQKHCQNDNFGNFHVSS